MNEQEKVRSEKPEFDGGSFVISHLSTSPEGFEFATRESVRRRPNYEKGILTEDQKGELAKAMKREMNFQGAEKVREAKATGDEEYEEKRKKYVSGMVGKIGLRNVKVEGNTIIADAKFVGFHVYDQFAKPTDSKELIDFSAATGTAMVVRSSDGRIVIQHRAVERQKLDRPNRTRGNASYTDIPGASVAGLLDAKTESPMREKGTPDPVDTESIRTNIFKEAGEELGLDDEDLTQVRIAGIAEDNIKIHHELLLLADTNLTADEIKSKSRTSNRNKNLGEADFEEKFVDIEGTPQAIEKLLAEVHCPLPPTHAAVLAAAGYSLILQKEGLDAANNWRESLEKKVQANYKYMDEKVRQYYNKYPKALAQVPERFWMKNVPSRNFHGYTPAYTPEEQGLPSFEDEMVRVGLIPETREKNQKAFLFDVDGVLTDPKEKKVMYDELFNVIVDKLKHGLPVGLNTGRSVPWMEDRIINPLIARLGDNSLLTKFVAIGEKGGTWVSFDKDGNPNKGKVANLVVPDDLKEKVRSLIEEQYASSMFFDNTKETMLSTEMHDGYDLAEYTKQQKELVIKLSEIVAEGGYDSTYKVDPTTIATDVEYPHVGKAVGADRFRTWLRDNDLLAEEFVAFGDSASDFEMADELESRGEKVEFVFVGDRDKLGEVNKDYHVEFVPGFTEGTLNYLKR